MRKRWRTPLEKWIKQRGMTARSFWLWLGGSSVCSYTAVYRWVTGVRHPSPQHLKIILEKTGEGGGGLTRRDFPIARKRRKRASRQAAEPGFLAAPRSI